MFDRLDPGFYYLPVATYGLTIFAGSIERRLEYQRRRRPFGRDIVQVLTGISSGFWDVTSVVRTSGSWKVREAYVEQPCVVPASTLLRRSRIRLRRTHIVARRRDELRLNTTTLIRASGAAVPSVISLSLLIHVIFRRGQMR
jgi:hypothetical protein